MYITTAIDYPNALPHNGTAFEKIGADVQARYRRSLGEKTLLLMGNDENTIKVVKATPEGQTTKEYVDTMAHKFQCFWNDLSIHFNRFIQTSSPEHHKGVTKFTQTVYDAGFIYKKMFKSAYCEGCEEFKTTKSLIDGKCPNHPNVIISEVEEENYFFKLSLFKDEITELICNNTINVKPLSRLNEVKEFLSNDLEDISISRINKGWGIPIPWDHSQTIYVWFDALLSYLTGIGFGTNEALFDEYWPAQVHIIGKDITRFHCIIFPAMILAYNTKADTKIALPKSIFAHGFVYLKKGDEFIKESKSNNSSSLSILLDEYREEAYRYYFLSRANFGSDTEYNAEMFKTVYNADLANNLGNLVSRTIQMILSYSDGHLVIDNPTVKWLDIETFNQYCNYTEEFNYKSALGIVWDLLRKMNHYIEVEKPWATFKTEKEKCLQSLQNVSVAFRIIGMLLEPYLPSTSSEINLAFKFEIFPLPYIYYKYHCIAEDNFTGLESVTVRKINPLFPRK